jgi:hypothetical protein
MFEWTLFYRLLDLPDDLASPTHYDLLGLTPETCTPQTVQQALHERKNLLRQNIPDPQFIPLVLRFESEQLEPAARVLADPQIRRQYDDQLKKQDRQSPADWINAERARVIQKARKLVLDHSSDDGTLDEQQKPILAEKLSRLGFSPGDIRVLFQGIPTTAPQTLPSTQREVEFFINAIDMARIPQGLAAESETRLLNLAQHLGIPPEEARRIIQKQLTQPISASDQIRILPDESQETDPQISPFPKITTSADSQVFVVTDVVDSSDSAPVALIQTPMPPPTAVPVTTAQYQIARAIPRPNKLWVRLLKIMAPILVSGCFLAFILYNQYNPIVPKARDRQTSDTPDTQSNPDNIPEPANNQNNTTPIPPTPGPSSTTPPPIDPYTPSEIVTQIQQSFSISSQQDQLLTDLALITLACRDYAYSYARKQLPTFDSLAPLLKTNHHTERANLLTANVQLSLDFAQSGKSTAPSDPQWLSTLEKMLEPDKPKSVQYRAIEELAVDRSPQAAEILMKILESKRKLDEQIVARILRALEYTADPMIHLRLVDLLEAPPHRSFVQPILLTLIKLSGRSNSLLIQKNSILPFIHTSQQRQDCAQWWREYFVQRHPYITQNVNPNASGANNSPQSQLLAHDTKILKLIAQTAHYAQNTADTLSQFRWNHNSPPINNFDDSLTVFAHDNVAGQLQNSLDLLAAAHFYLVRTHPEAQKFTAKIDQIELRKQTNSLLSDNNIQCLLVHWDTTGQLLELLIKQLDTSGRSPVALNQIRLQKPSSQTNSMEAVRDRAYYNLLLWDYLTSQFLDTSENVI